MKNVANFKIRLATNSDLRWCMKHDSEARNPLRLMHKIALNEIVVAEVGCSTIGYLRLECLWMRVPYIGLIILLPKYRRHGIGRGMLRFVERRLRKERYKFLLSSSQVDEPYPSQAWHRAMGFEECGIINGVNDKGVGEVFFRKSLPH